MSTDDQLSSKRAFHHQASFMISPEKNSSKNASSGQDSPSKDVEAEAEFWLSLINTNAIVKRSSTTGTGANANKPIAKRRASKSYAAIDPTLYDANTDDSEDLNNVVEKFDLTRASTDALFDSFDENDDGELSHREFRVALAQQDLFNDKTPESTANFQRLIKYVDVNNDGALSRVEYAMCLQKLKLASLYLSRKLKTDLLHGTYFQKSHMNTLITNDGVKIDIALCYFGFKNDYKRLKQVLVVEEGDNNVSVLYGDDEQKGNGNDDNDDVNNNYHYQI